MPILDDYQVKAVEMLKTGAILCGDTGSGKSMTALAYFHEKVCKGQTNPWRDRLISKKLYIITTARKRDTHEWEDELIRFLLVDGMRIECLGELLVVTLLGRPLAPGGFVVTVIPGVRRTRDPTHTRGELTRSDFDHATFICRNDDGRLPARWHPCVCRSRE